MYNVIKSCMVCGSCGYLNCLLDHVGTHMQKYPRPLRESTDQFNDGKSIEVINRISGS